MRPIVVCLLLLAVLFLSGCTSSLNELGVGSCEPEYLIAQQVWGSKMDDSCKSICYQKFETTSYKLTDQDAVIPTANCYCDINKCKQSDTGSSGATNQIVGMRK
jgi:hypothetical protein